MLKCVSGLRETSLHRFDGAIMSGFRSYDVNKNNVVSSRGRLSAGLTANYIRVRPYSSLNIRVRLLANTEAFQGSSVLSCNSLF